jgi:RNA polymerase sigma factor (TIGR02999 family)
MAANRYNFVGMAAPPVDITRLLRAWAGGDEAALEQLAPAVYTELHRMARHYMRRESPGNTLQTTALVNEVYLRLVDAAGVTWQDRAHFFAISAQMMRRILIDAARARVSAKRGGLAGHLNLDAVLDAGSARAEELIALDDALNCLAEIDPRKMKVIELRFFGGLSVEETAEVLKISPQSVMRDWKLAKAWLQRELKRKH